MSESSRFASPTSGFELSELLGRLRGTFWASFGLGALLHLALVAVDPFRDQAAKAPRPLTTRFIKREPRLTKPLELRKIPQPRRQMVRRKVGLAPARMDQVRATAAFNTGAVIGQVAHPGVILVRESALPSPDLEPRAVSLAQLAGTRTPGNKIDMALEMMDINAMDTGRYRSMVIQDPNDPQGVTGFVKLAQVLSARSIEAGQSGSYSSIRTADMDILRDMLNEYTGIKGEYAGMITYDDERMMEVPILVPLGTPNESELEALSRYLLAGGFVMGPLWPRANEEQQNRSIRLLSEALEKYGGLVQGRDFWTERIPDRHPIYSAFFDVRGGMVSGYGTKLASGKQGVPSWPALTGYYVKGRLAGISSRQGTGWLDHTASGDGSRQLQMAVNIIVFALTQEGSMTQRLMQMVN